ncbi:uncharacterized protein N7496_003459 [Penicillium cataractarum]|uniref:Transposase Tc1-like domain-containing protein n=1 Tax=Penicillium cataractarum TaxID=2100454 RepID=A0A9W9SM07_9EURO|nr:uncharacterized protein N7496_003459 [Penicillium cataractarum]KAJ5381031.1 hypothetical protein N7496_003459 [Penicillium cataractarum]
MAKQSTIARRATVVALKAYTPKSSAEIAALTDLSVPSVNRIYGEAIKRGFDPHRTMIDNQYVEDKPGSGRPTKHDPTTVEIVLSKVRLDRYGREKTCADLAGDLSKLGINISGTTIHRILENAGFRKTKPTRKPGLTKKMRAERLAWCLAHEHWTKEDWKNVIFSDETSVILLHRRGGYRIWRTKDERFLRSCICERWKGASEFMFWGCFSYDKKGPCHCSLPETGKEKRDAEKEVERLNKEIEPTLRTSWEIETGLRRLNMRQNLGGRKPTWKFTAKTGKLGRGKKGGIDWYRYQHLILLPKLLPFAQECAIQRPATLVQEDKAPAHNHYIQQRVFDAAKVQRLLWCPNSPDLNAIEPAWPWMKRRTTRKGAPKTRQEAFAAWQVAWQDLP